ncbi:MAG: 3'-5' exonuclease [Deltaproteobacteria bacterium]|nr:3'-5' exonuclease [Deltaproteobacteria bacterium]
MSLQLSRPLVVFDLEATGRDPFNDRIVELGVVIVKPDGQQFVRDWRIHPTIPIPPEVTLIHGITDQDVVGCPTFAELVPTLISIFTDVDVSGFNARGFDVPMLDCEFMRAGVSPSPLEQARIVDSKEIFHSKEPRDLSAAVRFYCKEELVGAHGAKADALAATKVLLAQLDRYPDLPRSVDALVPLFQPKERYVDPTRKLKLDDKGEAMINFGQHRGTKLTELVEKKRDYLEWIMQGEWHPKVKEAVKAVLDRFPASAAQRKSW